jgi:hypothetical protein
MIVVKAAGSVWTPMIRKDRTLIGGALVAFKGVLGCRTLALAK